MKNKLIIFTLFFAGLMVSCTKDLTIDPDSKLTDANAFTTKSSFINGLAGVYTNLWCWDEVAYKIGGSTDEMVFPARGADWKGDLQPMYLHTWTKTNGEVAGIYEKLSILIAVCNKYIATIDASAFKDDSDIQVMKSETRFLRAFSYFLMCDMFGNVPLVTDAAYDPNNLPKQATRAQIYDFVKSELTEVATIHHL